ncbi:MAG TPA: NAD(P)H-quinone dehydrogenase [Actinomycetes bacterium]|nr:NAD(P)H-quinone dehydrogenase [Actinomycetes bacterium]
MTRIAIVGGGPGGYEAALVAARLGAEVTVVDRDGAGGSAVLTDCVPSKTLIATAEVATLASESGELGVVLGGLSPGADQATPVGVDIAAVNARVKRLASAQSADIAARLERDGVRILRGSGRLDGPHRVVAELADGGMETVQADAILLATGAHPRIMPEAEPDGERILTWTQVYDLSALPERLIVVGSGVTGAEFASGYQALGSAVTLVSSRDRVLPGEDADAAGVLQDVFKRRGMQVLSKSRAASVRRKGDGVIVTLTDGQTVEGTHCLMAVGSLPNTEGLGLDSAEVRVGEGGFIDVDRVSRTSAQGIYAAGDCTGVLMLASVAAMQGRIAMWHMLGAAVTPLDLRTVAATVFTDPEIATVGYSQQAVESGQVDAEAVKLPLATNPRAKMQGITEGFVKLFCRRGTGIVVGGVVVAPRASELIYPVALAVDASLTVNQLAHAFTVYPSLTGSIAEAARLLHGRD